MRIMIIKNCDSCRYCGRDWEDHPCKTCEEMKDGSCTNYAPEKGEVNKEHDGCVDCKYKDKASYQEPCCNCKCSKIFGSNEYKSAPDMWCKDNGDDEPDMVNHPPHYEGDIECIDAMIQQFGEGVYYFCVCNAFKYLWRSEHKHSSPLEDLKKAEYYIRKAVEILECEDE